MKSIVKGLFVIVAVLFVVSPAMATNAISVNLVALGTPVGAGTAGVVSVGNWNDYPGSSGSIALTDSNGNATATSYEFSSSGTSIEYVGGAAIPGDSGSTAMLTGHIYQGPGTILTGAFTGISYAEYDLYVYYNSSAVANGQTFTLRETGAFLNAWELPGADTSLVESDGIIDGNYVVFRGLKLPNVTVDSSSAGYVYMNGYQIVEVSRAIYPSKGEGNVLPDALVLNWLPGENATSHDVYFGTSYDEVNSAERPDSDLIADKQVDTADLLEFISQWLSPQCAGLPCANLDGVNGIDINDFSVLAGEWLDQADDQYKGNQPLGNETYNIGNIEWDTTYYWRIDDRDDYNAEKYKGDVWQFTTKAYPDLYSSIDTFGISNHIVSTSVFVWYPGQASGSWLPLDGLANWNSSVAWWKSQIKQIMVANIDIMLVHLVDGLAENRTNLFQAMNELRAEGYNVPRAAPFLDPLINWNGTSIDVATTAGKDAFVNVYKLFFDQYYSVNQDSYADDYIGIIDNRVILDTWHVHTLSNAGSLSRSDVESRLAAEYGVEHPIFNNGIYMMGTEGNGLNFCDEQFAQFQYHEYWHRTVYNSVPAMQLKGGYWDQNIRDPGYIMPRDGGANYDYAWTRPDRLTNWRVYIESWNEYDEGSGIYLCDVDNSPYIAPGNPSNDFWSDSNDPWEYIKTTAAGVHIFKIDEVPGQDSRILWHDFPTPMYPGQVCTAQVVVRNEGALSWTGAANYKFGQKENLGEAIFGSIRYPIDDQTNEISFYGGIFRGRPIMFTLTLVAPGTPGQYSTHWSMLQEGVAWFGEELAITIDVN